MRIQSQPPTRPTTQKWEPGPPEPPHRNQREVFVEGAKIGLLHFGIPALVGGLIPGHAQLAGALTGAGVGYARAGAQPWALLGGAFLGAASASATARFGLLGALAATGIGALAMGAAAVQNDMRQE